MKKLGLLLIGILLTSFPMFTDQVSADKPLEQKHAPDRLLVKFKLGVSEFEKKHELDKNNAQVLEEISQLDVKILKVPPQALDGIEKALKKSNKFEFVEKDAKFEPLYTPNDQFFSRQWYLSMINAPTAWDKVGSNQVKIAILDTGVDPDHQDLQGLLQDGYNSYDNNNNWSNVCGHGTGVTGSATSLTNNEIGIAGTAPNAKIIPIRVTDTSCYAYYSTLAKGIVYAADNGAKVANVSFQIFDGAVLTDSAKYMYSKGGLVVAAAGNTGSYQNYSDNPYIISVGSTDNLDKRANHSTFGPFVDFVTPGVAIYTTFPNNLYGYASGTSVSAPIMSGVIAMMYATNPSLTPSQVYDILKTTSVDLGDAGYDYYFGWGRVDANAAVVKSSSINNEDPPIDENPPIVDTPVLVVPNSFSVEATDHTGTIVYYPDPIVEDKLPIVNGPTCIKSSGSKFPIGQNKVICSATNSAGYTGYGEFVVTVTDITTPQVNIISPINGDVINGMSRITVSASDQVGIDKIQVYVNEKLVGTLSSSGDVKFNAKSIKDKIATINAVAYDISGNKATASISVFIAGR